MLSRLSQRYRASQGYMRRLNASDRTFDVLLRFAIAGLIVGVSLVLTLLALPHATRWLQVFIDFFSFDGGLF